MCTLLLPNVWVMAVIVYNNGASVHCTDVHEMGLLLMRMVMVVMMTMMVMMVMMMMMMMAAS